MAELRPFQPADLSGVVRVLAAAMPVDPISESRFVRQVLLDSNFRAEGAIVAQVGDEIVGFCLAIARQVPLENAPPDADRGYITLLGVLPAHQRRGIGSAMLELAENYLRSQGRTLVMVSPYAPGYFICGVDVAAYESGLRFLLKHGYQEVYRPIAMQIDLWNFQVPQWVRQREAALQSAGVAVEPYCAELTLPLLDFAAREFAGDWVRVCRQTMTQITLGDRADRLMVAYERQSGRVVGYSHYENERFGPIGVAGSERGRGLGHILMYRTLEAQRLAGFRAAWFLWSDDTTAGRLYTAAGFRTIRRFALLKKPLKG
ncbi:GNAT family N-acetyltransferase [Fontivita pretiosa]|uniref:GNAT family N-acetyltransferase n=1 Tax=Fontivita pretiosa TaxID=2989684 RepID=UPI003D1755C9